MSRKRYTPEQIISMLREAEVALAQGQSVGQACRTLGVSEQSYYRWREMAAGTPAPGVGGKEVGPRDPDARAADAGPGGRDRAGAGDLSASRAHGTALPHSQRADAAISANVHACGSTTCGHCSCIRAHGRPGGPGLCHVPGSDWAGWGPSGPSSARCWRRRRCKRSCMLTVIYSMVFAASTAVVWWFGDRAFTPPSMRGR